MAFDGRFSYLNQILFQLGGSSTSWVAHQPEHLFGYRDHSDHQGVLTLPETINQSLSLGLRFLIKYHLPTIHIVSRAFTVGFREGGIFTST